MGTIASTVQRFFHPAAIDQMLETFVPMINGTNLNVCSNLTGECLGKLSGTKFELQSLLSTQFFMLTFLPQCHPQSYLPMFFRLWESVNSYMFDERMLQFLAQLAELHVDPAISDPKKIDEVPDDARSENEGRPNWDKKDLSSAGLWAGIFKDVGIFTDYDWHFIMCKCLASMGMVSPWIPSNVHFVEGDHDQKFHLRTRGLSPQARPPIAKPALRLVAFRSPLGGSVSLSQFAFHWILMSSSFVGAYNRLFHGSGRTSYRTI